MTGGVLFGLIKKNIQVDDSQASIKFRCSGHFMWVCSANEALSAFVVLPAYEWFHSQKRDLRSVAEKAKNQLHLSQTFLSVCNSILIMTILIYLQTFSKSVEIECMSI